jgi:PilZ domain
MNAPGESVDSRISPRMPVGGNLWIKCRRTTPTLGADIANGILDLSPGGVQLLSKAVLHPGDTVEVTLGGSGIRRSILRRGEVRWMVELGDGACCAGVRFDEPIAAEDARTFTAAEPRPAGAFDMPSGAN